MIFLLLPCSKVSYFNDIMDNSITNTCLILLIFDLKLWNYEFESPNLSLYANSLSGLCAKKGKTKDVRLWIGHYCPVCCNTGCQIECSDRHADGQADFGRGNHFRGPSD